MFSTLPTSEAGWYSAGTRSDLPRRIIERVTADLNDEPVLAVRIDGVTRLVAAVVASGEAIGFVVAGEFGGPPLSVAQVRQLQSRSDVADDAIQRRWSELRPANLSDGGRDMRMTRWLARTLGGWCVRESDLRSTRETELAERIPMHVVCAWIGNSQPVAMKHYLQVTDEHFERAVSGALQNPVQSPAASSRTDAHGEPANRTGDTENAD